MTDPVQPINSLSRLECLDDVRCEQPQNPCTQIEVGSELARQFSSQYRQLIRFCRMRVRNEADAEDIVQSAFLAAGRAYPDKGIDELGPLMTTMVRNRLIDFLKSSEARRQRLCVEIGDVADSMACARSPTPEQQLMDIQDLGKAGEIIAAMAPHRRDALLLHRIEGLTYAQIEVRLSMSRTGVIVAIAEAVAELAEGLGRAERRRTPSGR
jgi:RNA polymerase sigma factor (sigma-70 family)